MATFIESLFQRESVPVIESSLGFNHQKQLAIMNNIANVETPGYKRQSLPEKEFTELLSKAIKERAESHLNSFEVDDGFNVRFADGHYPVMDTLPGMDWGPERHDENNVVIEKEMADLAKNTLMIQTGQRLFRKKLDMLRSSLRDRVV